jgi:hypothetical protein
VGRGLSGHAPEVGFGEYINWFFDWFPDEGEPYPNSAVTPAEHAALAEVHRLMIRACDDTPGDMTNDEFIATGWPQRIQPVAARAAAMMLARGRFSEDHEEEEPSGGHE